MKLKQLLLAALLLVSGGAHAQLLTKFGPVNGILVGTVANPQTAAATQANVLALWTGGGCTGTNVLQANGACGTGSVPSGTANLVYATPNGSSGSASLRALVGADVAPINLASTANGGVLSTSILLGTNGGTSNGFFSVTGPTTALRTFTFPNASATVLTTNAAVTVAQGGTGLATLTANGVTIGEGTSSPNFVVMGADTVLRGTAAADPVATAVNNCGSSTQALSYSTSTHTFGCQTISAGGTVANPTALVGLTAVNGSATSAIRSDGAPALDVSISPTWTGSHTFNNAISIPGGFGGAANANSTFTSSLSNSNTGTSSATQLNVLGSAGHGLSLIALGASNTTAPCSGCLAVGDSATLLAGGAGGLSIGVVNSERMRIGNSGRVTINAPSADTALVVNGIGTAGNFSGSFGAANNTGTSFGVAITAGTNTSDFALDVGPANGSSTHLFRVDGSGRLIAPQNYSSAGAVSTTAAGIFTTASDLRLKNIVGPADAGLNEILQLKPIRYRWNEASQLDDPAHTVYTGFGAQDVLAVIPDAVGQRPDGYYTLYDRPITAALVNAVKEQQHEINLLRATIAVMLIWLAFLTISRRRS